MLSTRIIKINNFLMHGSLGCIVPYLSTYYEHYTTGTPGDLGWVMLVAYLLGMVINLTVCSIADRYKAHLKVYLFALLLTYTSFLSLFVPIIFHQVYETEGSHSAPIRPVLTIAGLDTFKHFRQQNKSTIDFDIRDGTPEAEQVEVEGVSNESSWFYYVSTCLIMGEIGSTILTNLSDSFSANFAFRLNKTYGSLRFWGGLGWVCSSIILVFINTIEWAPFLAPALTLLVVIGSINILTVAFWPDKRPFDLSDESIIRSPSSICIDKDSKVFNKTKFSFASVFTLTGNKAYNREYLNDLSMVSVGESLHDLPVVVTKIEPKSFDTNQEDVYRNIRRCSLAPLGANHLVKQFELNEDSGRHFKFVTKIEHRRQSCENSKSLPVLPEVELEELRKRFDLVQYDNQSETRSEIDTKLSLSVHFRIVMMIITNNRQILRFLFLFMVNGFTVNLNWLYLFTYLKSLDELKFLSLSAYVMIACYMAESLFYYTSPEFTRWLSQSVNLSIILIIYGIRYSLYLVFAIEGTNIPLELIIVVELSQALNMGWFNCVLNESAVDFALEARNCVPELISRGLIDDSKETIERVQNSVKVTMLSISSCCFDGFGMAFGSVCGGLIIDRFGYETLWITSAVISFTVGFLNLFFPQRN